MIRETNFSLQENNFTMDNIHLVGICAVHINSDDELAACDNMLESRMMQTIHKPLYLQISGINKQSWDMIISEWRNKYSSDFNRLIISTSSEKQSQFRNYQILCNRLKIDYPDVNPWIFFSDGDDFWGPTRVETYRNLVKSAEEKEAVNGIKYTCLRILNGAIRGSAPLSTKINDTIIRSAMNDRLTQHYVNGILDNSAELWMSITPLSYLNEFFQRAPSVILDNFFTDMYFEKYITNYGHGDNKYKTLSRKLISDTSWIYFYRFHDKSVCRTINIDNYINDLGVRDLLQFVSNWYQSFMINCTKEQAQGRGEEISRFIVGSLIMEANIGYGGGDCNPEHWVNNHIKKSNKEDNTVQSRPLLLEIAKSITILELFSPTRLGWQPHM